MIPKKEIFYFWLAKQFKINCILFGLNAFTIGYLIIKEILQYAK